MTLNPLDLTLQSGGTNTS